MLEYYGMLVKDKKKKRNPLSPLQQELTSGCGSASLKAGTKPGLPLFLPVPEPNAKET